MFSRIEHRVNGFFEKHGLRHPIVGALFWLVIYSLLILSANALMPHLPGQLARVAVIIVFPAGLICFLAFLWRLTDLIRKEKVVHSLHRLILMFSFLMCTGYVFCAFALVFAQF